MVVVLLTLLGSLVTSFIGSFACFIIWVHFDFDSRWEDRKERNRIADIRRGLELENEYRMRQGLPPLPDAPRPGKLD
jgi:hypothetical protein